MIVGPQHNPFIEPSVPSLISFWNAGLAAHRAAMIVAVEGGAGQSEFLDAARSQVPLVELIINEFKKFSHEGWTAIPGMAGKRLSALDRKRLSLFRDNALNSEGFFTSMVEIAETDQAELRDWYGSAYHVYRRRPALGPMIRGICTALLPESIAYQVRVLSDVDYNLHLRDECFEPARIAFTELAMNAIKFNKPGGQMLISNQGTKLLFSDTGIGMHPHFAMSLVEDTELRREEGRVDHLPGKGEGWPTIRRIAFELGWWITPDSEIGKGTDIEIIMNEANFINPEGYIARAPELLDGGIFTFSKVEPFHGYRLTNSGVLDVSKSPIYLAAARASKLLSQVFTL